MSWFLVIFSHFYWFLVIFTDNDHGGTFWQFFKSMFKWLLGTVHQLLVALGGTAGKNPNQRCYSWFISLELTTSRWQNKVCSRILPSTRWRKLTFHQKVDFSTKSRFLHCLWYSGSSLHMISFSIIMIIRIIFSIINDYEDNHYESLGITRNH